jgi:hypothetical protein
LAILFFDRKVFHILLEIIQSYEIISFSFISIVFSFTENNKQVSSSHSHLTHSTPKRVLKHKKAMPEETTSIDYAMEAASGPHFSGLRLDARLSSSSPTSSLAPNSTLTSDSLLNQPFVIGIPPPLSLSLSEFKFE